MADEPKPESQPPSEKPPAPKAAPPPAKPAAGGHAAKPAAPAVMAATPWEGELPAQIKQEFGDRVIECSAYLGQNFVVVKPEAIVEFVEYLKLEAEFDYLVDVTALDYPDRPERFEVIYILYSFARNERIRVKIRVADGFKPESVTGVHLTANWLEREVFDMFGIEFAGHPDMKRILLPDEWQGHPLRKNESILNMDNRWVQENLGIESGQ
jgi:NADH-quinone oxidoreductase subunit C